MCTVPLAFAGFSAVGKIQQGRAAAAQDRYNSDVAARNATFSLWQAEDARKRGDLEASRVHRQGDVLAATQQATVAANGLDITSQGVLDIIDDTQILAEADALTIRANAEREAFKYETQAGNFTNESQNLLISARDKRRAGVLSGVTSFLGGVRGTQR